MSMATLDLPAMEQFTREFEALFNDGDASGMAACYAEDARLLAENAPLISGRATIEQFWRTAIERARAANATRTIRPAEVTTSGDLGYALGTVTVTIPDGRLLTTKFAVI
jgi:ketosteroid isomerase-like protein